MDKWKLAAEADSYAANWDNTGYPNLTEWFMLAWAREVPTPVSMLPGAHLNLGAGRRQIGDAVPLDLEHGWDGEKDAIPYGSDSVGGIWAHGFFEHLTPHGAVRVLKECQRVLKVGAPLSIVVPHGMSELWHEELEHLSVWHEETLRNLLSNPYYERGSENEWRLRVHTQVMMGVVWRNIALMTQLVKF